MGMDDIFRDSQDDKVYFSKFRHKGDNYAVEIRYNPVLNFFVWYSEPSITPAIRKAVTTYICSRLLPEEPETNPEYLVVKYLGVREGTKELADKLDKETRKRKKKKSVEKEKLSEDLVPEDPKMMEDNHWLLWWEHDILEDYREKDNGKDK